MNRAEVTSSCYQFIFLNIYVIFPLGIRSAEYFNCFVIFTCTFIKFICWCISMERSSTRSRLKWLSHLGLILGLKSEK